MSIAENVVVANRFRLIRLIGRGGMGSVWQASDQNLGTDCAIKFIEGDLATNMSDAHARFKREAQAAAQLRSPHIVQIFDHNIWEGIPYLAMELLEGEDLAHRIERFGKIPPNEVLHIMSQVCRALSKAHEKGIIHRDLKPENVFLVRDDDREIAKVLDFGIAKQLNGGLEVGSNTKTGTLLGTPNYMSPEQAQGVKAVDTRSDLWALAVIVFQCLTGKLPFESEALGDLLIQIIVRPVPIPSQIDPSVPLGFDAWFAKATEREPSLRFQTAKAFAESLTVALGGTLISPIRTEYISQPLAVQSSPVHSALPTMAEPLPVVSAASPGPVASARPVHSVTFSGTDIPAGVPKKGGAGLVIAVAVGALLVGAIGVGVVMLRKSPTSQAVAAPSSESMTSATPVAIAKPDPSPPSSTGGSAVPQNEPGAAANPATSATTSATTASAALTLPKPGIAAAPKPKPTSATTAAVKPPAAPKPPAKPDLGF